MVKQMRVFLQVFEEGKEEEGEYIVYNGEKNENYDATEFVHDVHTDLLVRAQLINEGKSIITGVEPV